MTAKMRKQFTCPACGKSFKSRSGLGHHLFSVHGRRVPPARYLHVRLPPEIGDGLERFLEAHSEYRSKSSIIAEALRRFIAAEG